MQINNPPLFYKQSYKKSFAQRGWKLIPTLFALLVVLFGAVGYSAEAHETGGGIINSPSSGTIDGTVFRDFNANGTQAAGEPGVAGITVSAFDGAGAAQGTATTIANGTYSLAATGTGPYRIEFTGIPSYLQAGANGTNSDSSVQFVADGNSSNVDMGLNNPADYNQVDPDMAISIMTNGNQTAGNPSIRETSSNVSTAGATDKVLDTATGSIWGLAYQRESSTLFSAAFLKRHVAFGSGGMDAIYATDDSNTTAVFVELSDDLGISVGTTPSGRGMTGPTDPSYDVEVYALIGKRGLGDIDFDENTSTLWVVNLEDRRLYGIANIDPAMTPVVADVLEDSSNALGFEINNTASPITCNEGQLRPFAVKVQDDQVFVGAVCSGEESAAVMGDMDAYILALDTNDTDSGFSEVISFNMDYSRLKAVFGGGANWNTWYDGDSAYSASSMPQPMLTDIEVDNDGSLIIGINDRFGHQVGPLNYLPDPAESDTLLTSNDVLSLGDILRVCKTSAGYFMEGDASCPTNPRPASEDDANSGTADRGISGGEYYVGDWAPADADDFGESVTGGLAMIPGSDDVISTIIDPTAFFEGGMSWLDNSDGHKVGTRLLYTGGMPFFSKSAGLGDMELLSDPAPLEIGNRLWCDADSDGIQDADESAVPAGVTVTMSCGAESATTTTDMNGNYLFTDAIWAAANSGDDMPRAASCTVSVDTSGADGTIISNACGVSTPTTVNAASGLGDGNDDIRDSDATQNGSNVEIIITTGSAGQNDHTEDFGFGTAMATVEIGNRVWTEADGDGIADNDASDQPVVGTVVTAVNGSGTSYTTTTDAAGLYTISVPANATYTVTVSAPASHDPSTVIVAGTDNNPATNNNRNHNNSGAVVAVGTVSNYTIDFGFTPQASFKKVEIGNYVWLDNDEDGGQNESGTGIANVVVNLYPPIGSTLIATTTTDATGYYTFTKDIHNIIASTSYVIRIDTTQPTLSAYAPTVADSTAGGTDDSTDSDGIVGSGGFANFVGVALTSPIAGSVDYSYDFGFTQDAPILGAIGNYVWLDENADGQQDEGERGVPNVTVNMVNASGTVYTTTTDTDGGYLFPDLPAGTYTVTVAASNFAPDGALEDLEQTPLGGGDGDFGNKDDAGYPIVLDAGEENLTADFGYNPDPEDTNNNENLAALGDYVWIDSDGDGAQDAGETPVAGVELVLYTDPDGNGIYDTAVATETTDANGYYLFDTLPAGSYKVTVTDSSGASHDILGADYTQAGDPDHFGTTGANNDNMSEPVVLAPGDVFLNVDFGYQPEVTAAVGTIGDTVWLDIDASGTAIQDAGEPGITGVTVALIQDTNGNGVWDAGEPIISTDTTDESGNYLFTGLPLDESYIVWVNDTDNVLDGLDQTYDQDAPLDNMSATTLTGVAPDDLDQDFSYTPAGQTAALGAIGDTVWFDTDRDGVEDPEESGIEGVLVTLTDDMGAVITTMTDENGHYYFGGLPLDETYTVTVSAENFLPGSVLEGTEQTFDDDGLITPHESVTTLTPAVPVDLDQDFGYVGDDSSTLGSIGNRVWLDQNADGDWDGVNGPDATASTDDDEPGIAGVTIDLYRDLNGNGLVDAGEPLIGTQTTDADGLYLFDELPLGDYVVDVTDEGGILNGYWHSLGTQDASTNSGNDANDQSKADPFAVTIDAGTPDNLNVDFGYYVEPAALGNYVWVDSNDNGLQDDGETGINGVAVQLVIAYPDGTSITLTAITENDTSGNAGYYDFGNLLIDEDFAIGSGTGSATAAQPAYTISVNTAQAAVSAYITATVDVNTNGNDKEDSDDHTGVTAIPTQGLTDTSAQDPETNEQAIASYDFGFISSTVEIGNRVWTEDDGNGSADSAGDNSAPVVGALVTAVGSTGTVYTATTDANGLYTITVPVNATYTVTVATPSGHTPSTVLLAGTDSNPAANNNENHNNSGAVVTVTTVNNYTIDFGFTPIRSDWGDLPDTFGTTSGASGPSHVITDSLYLGSCVDDEGNGIPDAIAGIGSTGGDDHGTSGSVTGTACTDDEDGIILTTPMVAGSEACVSVAAINTTGSNAFLNGWVDFNGDGDFTGDANESVLFTRIAGTVITATTNAIISSSGSADYCFQVPSAATFDGGETHMRFRLSSAGSLGSGGSATNGEVEDYYSPFTCLGNYVWMDWDEDGFQDATENGVPNVVVSMVWYGANNSYNSGAGDDRVYTTTTAANGTYSFCGLTAQDGAGNGGTYEVQLINPVIPVATVYNAGGVSDTQNSNVINESVITDLMRTVPVTILAPDYAATTLFNLPTGEDGQEDGTGTVNNYPDSSVDLTIDLGFDPHDMGDLPDTNSGSGSFATNTVNGGEGDPALHLLSNISPLYLGSCVDAEVDGAAGTAADGDDGATGFVIFGTCISDDDEDGVTLITPLIPSSPACVSVSADLGGTATGVLQGWIDFNGDGDFAGDATDILMGQEFGTGSITITADITDQIYCFDVPSDASTLNGDVYMRFRFSEDGLTPDGSAALSHNGLADTGEVEDYVLTPPPSCVGNYVWTDLGLDDVQGAGDSPISGLTVNMIWGGADGLISTGVDNVVYTTTTSIDGRYHFCGLLPDANNDSSLDEYRIAVPSAPATAPLLVTSGEGANDYLDSDGTEDVIIGGVTYKSAGPVFTVVTDANGDLDQASNDTSGLEGGVPDERDNLTFDFGFYAEQTSVGLSSGTAVGQGNLILALVGVALMLLTGQFAWKRGRKEG